MSSEMDTPNLKVLTTVPGLSDAQLQRLGQLVANRLKMDSWGGFKTPGGQEKQLDAILFRQDRLDDARGDGHTDISGVNAIEFDESPWIYLKATDGTITGWQDCQAIERGAWHYGVLFRDDEGETWFAGRNTHAPGGELTKAEVDILRPVSLDRSGMVAPFDGLSIMDDTEAFEAEIWITPADAAHPSHVVEISIGGDYGSRPADIVLDARQKAYLEEERAALAFWREQIRALTAEVEADHSPC